MASFRSDALFLTESSSEIKRSPQRVEIIAIIKRAHARRLFDSAARVNNAFIQLHRFTASLIATVQDKRSWAAPCNCLNYGPSFIGRQCTQNLSVCLGIENRLRIKPLIVSAHDPSVIAELLVMPPKNTVKSVSSLSSSAVEAFTREIQDS